MHEDAALDARNLVELVVPDSPPRLGQRLAALERLGVLGDGLDAPLAGRVGRLGVENVERELGFGNRERLLEEVEVLLWTFGGRQCGFEGTMGLSARRCSESQCDISPRGVIISF